MWRLFMGHVFVEGHISVEGGGSYICGGWRDLYLWRDVYQWRVEGLISVEGTYSVGMLFDGDRWSGNVNSIFFCLNSWISFLFTKFVWFGFKTCFWDMSLFSAFAMWRQFGIFGTYLHNNRGSSIVFLFWRHETILSNPCVMHKQV